MNRGRDLLPGIALILGGLAAQVFVTLLMVSFIHMWIPNNTKRVPWWTFPVELVLIVLLNVWVFSSHRKQRQPLQISATYGCLAALFLWPLLVPRALYFVPRGWYRLRYGTETYPAVPIPVVEGTEINDRAVT